MEIKDQLRNELKDAMRKRDQRRLDVIRQVETEMALVRSAPGFSEEVDDTLYQKVIAAYVKKMEKAGKEYARMGDRGEEMVDKLAFEVEYLSRWLPVKLSEAETRVLVKATIAELGLSDPKQAGRLVGQLMRTRGKELDGALVNRLAREELAGGE